VIRIDDVSKSYAGKQAVQSLTLNVEPGEVFAFIGANGAGKTTTIKMLVGLLRADEGTISVGGYNVLRSAREASSIVGYVPDQPFVYDKLTGREFLEFVGRMYGLNDERLAANLQRQVETFELSEFLDRLSETYSHGMKQRLVFAASMIHQPQVIVLDEPMVGLDPHSMRVVKDLLQNESRRGTAVFISTHTLPLAEEIADRIGVIQSGQLQFVGTLDDMRSASQREGQSLEQMFLALTRCGHASDDFPKAKATTPLQHMRDERRTDVSPLESSSIESPKDVTR